MNALVLFPLLGYLAWHLAHWLAETFPPYDDAMREQAEALDALERAHRRVNR